MKFRFAIIPAAIAVISAAAFAAPTWQEGNTYAAGTVVSFAGRDYKATQSHTAWIGTGWAPNVTPALWTDLGSTTGSSTTAPTTKPTVAPTIAPTTKPTAAPTIAPTANNRCTDDRANSKTAAPTIAPTAKPTAAPTIAPTAKPTAAPTIAPTAKPTAAPTIAPTAKPTAAPTIVPTAKPTATPTIVPTVKPTAAPTIAPTTKPTVAPTIAPTVAPTVAPTIAPTAKPTATPTAQPTALPSTGAKQVGTYFAEWSIYGRKFYLKNMQDSGQAAKLTFLNYSFANVYNRGGKYVCDATINKAESGSQDGGDAWAVFEKGFAANESVDGVADAYGWPTWDDPRTGVSGPLKGNLNQLKKLKAKNPNLKAVISLGGWTWSKWFSAAAATPELRQTLVASCIDVWIKGNIPFSSGANAGGPGSAAGVFDGIDIDWEYPAVQGIGTNTVSPDDKRNNTLLMAEFRKQLDELSKTTGKKYLLTVAIGAGDEKIAATEPAEYSKYLDWINIMSYDYNGGWDAAGPTDFQSNLYQDPASPRTVDPKTGKVNKYYTDAAVKDLIARGVPAAKLHMGVPFYGRGWTGVTNANNGLYQKATGPAKGTYEAGIEDYKVLKDAPGTEYIHPVTQQTYRFDGSTFWSYDTPRDIKLKADYAKKMGMGGIFSWEADGDTNDGALVEAMTHIQK
ncbi:chitinase [Deefgea tanakiae]|uniref:chitinase n=1 Tax=Deefgea tanakiae TaxID=2865840 RepID=A0ABX8Z4M2_9NEIS|nr:glycosyl hydrolase family 18 protein [Deefgea tanakiae]QZA77252.1 chitinase [Deefgea tanakiae]